MMLLSCMDKESACTPPTKTGLVVVLEPVYLKTRCQKGGGQDF